MSYHIYTPFSLKAIKTKAFFIIMMIIVIYFTVTRTFIKQTKLNQCL